MAKASNYYYGSLSKEAQKVYFAIYEGLNAMAPSFPVPMTDPKLLSEIYFMVRLDHPEIFYSVSYTYRYYRDAMNIEMMPEYLFKKDKLKEQRAAMASRVKKLVSQTEKLDEKGKEQFIHDLLVKSVKYDKLKKEYSHEIIGALGIGVAVCEGIAKAVKILCDEMGIWCIVAISESNPAKGIKYRHAWNVIRIGGAYYHLDTTFDNTLTKDDTIRYDYYNLPDKQIFRDHEPVIWPIPACTDGDHFYYREKKVSWTTMDEVRNRAKQAVKKGKPMLFHWRGGYFTKEICLEILKIIGEEAEAKDKQALCAVNFPQGVLKIHFENGKGKEQLEMEEANADMQEEAVE